MSVPTFRGVVAAMTLVAVALPAIAQDEDDDPFTTPQEVRSEVSQAMEAVAEYSAQERDAALATAREALNRLDAEIERREQALRENWSDMSESARETARERLRDLRQARNDLGERYGALRAGTREAWGELRAGFSDAWSSFSDAWSRADEQTDME